MDDRNCQNCIYYESAKKRDDHYCLPQILNKKSRKTVDDDKACYEYSCKYKKTM